MPDTIVVKEKRIHPWAIRRRKIVVSVAEQMSDMVDKFLNTPRVVEVLPLEKLPLWKCKKFRKHIPPRNSDLEAVQCRGSGPRW